MAVIEWNSTYSVGIEKIDQQHKQLFEMLNRLHEAMGSGKGSQAVAAVLEQLVQYTRTHFSDEENMMSAYQYPDFSAHKHLHEDLVRQISDFQKKQQANQLGLSIEVQVFLRNWLSKHILENDLKYSPFLKQKGLH